MTTCAWCNAEATTTVTLEPARMSAEKHAILGQRTITRRAAIIADACAACAAKPDGVPGRLRKDPRTVSFRDDLQTTIFDHMEP